MERRAPIPEKLSGQVESRVGKTTKVVAPIVSNGGPLVSTGSTLLDLAISGGRFSTGGVPGGILVEIFGPNSAGKTVLLCEIAGAVQRGGGKVMFRDPEARLNRQFAQLFGFEVADALYDTPNTVAELFAPIKKWDPGGDGINAIFADSLAALSTNMEMDEKDGMGMRRAKEFSEECRKVCRMLTQRNLLMVCSNQVRQNIDAGAFSEKYSTPGGMSIGFYASLRLRCHSPQRVSRERKIGSSDQKRVVGVKTLVEVYKNSVWEPYHSAPVYILFDYGIDDVRANLEFVKTQTGSSVFVLGTEKLGATIERAIKTVESDGRESDLRDCVVGLWHETEEKFKIERHPKRRPT